MVFIAINNEWQPERRDTFPAIALTCLYLEKEKQCVPDEVVVVMPSDPYTDAGYFYTIGQMAATVKHGTADLVLMGIRPAAPSTKYGYIVPADNAVDVDGATDMAMAVSYFTEKPDAERARKLIDGGALWNGGVFAFRLGYLEEVTKHYLQPSTFREARDRYGELPKISFDYEVVEKAKSAAVLPFDGQWEDLGTWNALSAVLGEKAVGNVLLDENCHNTHAVNTLDIPCICAGTDNLIVATSPDGILVANKDICERIKPLVNPISSRPMFEERRWGTYKVVDQFEAQNGRGRSLTKYLCIKAGKSISYQRHFHRDEVWTFVDGTGILVIDDQTKEIRQGDVVSIRKGQKHAVKAVTDLHFIEVQTGDMLEESDIERMEWIW